MSTIKKALSILLIILLLANIALFALRKIEVLFFWIVIIVIAALVHWGLPRIK